MIFERHDEGRTHAVGYDVRGEGPAVLFLHPFPFDRSLWRSLWRSLETSALGDFRLIRMDARGFGDSPGSLSEDGLSLDDLGDDAVALLDHLGVLSAAVVGCSLGGYVALSIAARHAARVSALALIDTRADADGELARRNRDAALAEVRAHGVAGYLDGVATRLCGRSSSDALRAEVQRMAATASPDPARAIVSLLTAMRDRPDRTPLLPALRLPVLVAVGEEDAVSPPDVARAMHAAIPGARLAILPACGHLAPVEQPDALREVLERFLVEELLPR